MFGLVHLPSQRGQVDGGEVRLLQQRVQAVLRAERALLLKTGTAGKLWLVTTSAGTAANGSVVGISTLLYGDKSEVMQQGSINSSKA